MSSKPSKSKRKTLLLHPEGFSTPLAVNLLTSRRPRRLERQSLAGQCLTRTGTATRMSPRFSRTTDDDATVASSVATDLGTDPEEDQKPAARSPSLVFPAYLDYNSEEEDAIDHLPPWNPLPENSEEQEAIRRSVAAAIRSREEEEAVDRWERANQMLVECGLAPVYSPRYSRKKQQVPKNNSDTDSTLDTSFSSESISSESSSTPIKEAN
jgi:hypothetical protein